MIGVQTCLLSRQNFGLKANPTWCYKSPLQSQRLSQDDLYTLVSGLAQDATHEAGSKGTCSSTSHEAFGPSTPLERDWYSC